MKKSMVWVMGYEERKHYVISSKKNSRRYQMSSSQIKILVIGQDFYLFTLLVDLMIGNFGIKIWNKLQVVNLIH